MTIDWWTLGFQTVNVAVLIWLLGHFFWKPVAGMIEARRTSTQKAMDDAAAAQAKAATALADVETTRAGFAEEREAILSEAHKIGDAARTVLLAKAKIDTDTLEAAAKAAIAKDEKSQTAAWAGRSNHLAIDVAGRLAARLDGNAVQARFFEGLLDAIRKLPEAIRDAEGANGNPLELASPAPLDPKMQASYGKSISEAFGGGPTIGFRTDAALIAGFELRGKHLVVASSWRADLVTIEADLMREHAA
jgi:F-type H+-transporting ATPase subunit b